MTRMPYKPILTIVVPTVHREVEFLKLVSTIRAQDHLNKIEVIIIDQNPDQRLSPAVSTLGTYTCVRYQKAPLISLSYAKNEGLRLAEGEYCLFLDDDCWLDENFLKVLVPKLKSNEACGYILNALNPDLAPLIGAKIQNNFQLSQQNKSRLFLAPQITQVHITATLKAINGFNLSLGVGTPFGSAEDSDILARVLDTGLTFTYLEEAILFHPHILYSSITPKKSFDYGLGFGAFCRIHGWYGYWIYKLIRPIGGALLNAFRSKDTAANYLATFLGRWQGFWRYR